MKRRLLITFFVVSTIICSSAIAQSDSAVWALTTVVPTNAASFTYTGSYDSAAYTTPFLKADSVVFSNMKGGYSSSKYKPSTGPNAATSGGTLPGYPLPFPEATYSIWRITNIDQGVAGTFPAESAYTPTRYFQFNVTPVATKEFHVTGLRIPMGGATTGNIRAEIYYSTDNFATSTLVASGVDLQKDTVNIFSYSIPDVVVTPSNKFSLRIYPWFSSTSPGSSKSIWAEAIAILGNAYVLPVTFESVNATQVATGINVNWSIATEINTDKYIVEKSADAKNFAAIGTVTAISAGNYSYTDLTPNTDINYYRIKALDKSGSVQYSSVVAVNTSVKASSINVYPNPVLNNQFNVQLSNLNKGNYTISVYNTIGQLVYSKSLSYGGQSTSLSIQLPTSVAKGIYRVSLNDGISNVSNKTISVQ